MNARSWNSFAVLRAIRARRAPFSTKDRPGMIERRPSTLSSFFLGFIKKQHERSTRADCVEQLFTVLRAAGKACKRSL